MKSKNKLIMNVVLVGVFIAIPNLCLAQFATLDKHSDKNQAGIQFGLTVLGEQFGFDDDDDSDTYFFRNELYGQFYHKWFGVYLSLPISAVVGERIDDHLSLGNLQLGLFHAKDLSDSIAISTRLGFGIPTAGDDSDDYLTNGIAGYYQLSNTFSDAIEAFSLRPSVSVIYDSEIFFARCDLGFDFVFPEKEGLENREFFRLNLGLGAHVGPIDWTLELVSIASLDEELSDDESVFHNLAVQVLLPLAHIRPYIAYVTPLDSRSRIIQTFMMGVNYTF